MLHGPRRFPKSFLHPGFQIFIRQLVFRELFNPSLSEIVNERRDLGRGELFFEANDFNSCFDDKADQKAVVPKLIWVLV